jgi:hypothetical protein
MTGRHPQYSYADYDKQRRSPIRHAPAETRYRVETKMQQYSGKFVSWKFGLLTNVINAGLSTKII